MIEPVKEDGLSAWNGYAFYLYTNKIRHVIYYKSNMNEPKWCWSVELNAQRRNLNVDLPGDEIASSVVIILNKNNNTAGMPLLEYLTKMGFDVSGTRIFSRLFRWLRRLFKRCNT